jgi:UDP:flavonoid glycosyltransferase YjiC (YdhE family)
MVQKRKIVITPASNITSHTGRCILIARELKKRGYEIILAGSSKLIRNPQIAKEDEFDYYELIDFDQEEAMRILRTMQKAYSRKTFQEHLAAELDMLNRLKPDLVIVDFRLTMCVSAKVLKVPIISLLNARWLPQYFMGQYTASDSHPISLLTKKILGKKMADFFWPYLVKLTLRYKLSPFPRAFRAHALEVKRYPKDILVGDYNLILDTKLWGPTKSLPSNFKQVGPIIWSPELNLPTWINKLDTNKRSVYVTMGTTGDKKLFQEIFKAFRDTECQIIASTGGQIEIDETMLSENLHVERFLPGGRVMEQVDMVICHGGSLTVYQAIQAGTPCIVIATHLDQEWGGEEIQTHKAGIFLTMVKVLAKPSLIMESTKKMFDNLEEYQNNMKRLQEDLLRYDGLKDAVSGIEGFIQQAF